MAIPKKFHRIWLGPNPIPDQHEIWWDAWRRQYPDYEFFTWRDQDIAGFPSVAGLCAEADSWAKKSDILRLGVIETHGGIYMDTDFMPVHRLEFAEFDDDLLLTGPGQDIVNGLFAAAPGHPALRAAIAVLGRTALNEGDMLQVTGPAFFARVAGIFPHRRLDGAGFYPFTPGQPLSRIYTAELDGVHAAHAWAGSWQQDWYVAKRAVSFLGRGDLRRLEEFLAQQAYDGEQRQHVERHVAYLRRVRAEHAEYAGTSFLADLLTGEGAKVLDPFKMGRYLFETQPDATVAWVGPGDGRRNHRARTLITHFDAETLLVEANRHLLPRLRAEFARNTRLKAVHGFAWADVGQVTLAALAPERLEQAGLPSWLAGKSHVLVEGRSVVDVARWDGHDAEPLLERIQACQSLENVQARPLMELADETLSSPPAVVFVDADGLESQIVHKMLTTHQPEIIVYAKATVAGMERQIDQILPALGYLMAEAPDVVTAVRRDFALAYCGHLYVEYGIKSIFAPALNVMFPDL